MYLIAKYELQFFYYGNSIVIYNRVTTYITTELQLNYNRIPDTFGNLRWQYEMGISEV